MVPAAPRRAGLMEDDRLLQWIGGIAEEGADDASTDSAGGSPLCLPPVIAPVGDVLGLGADAAADIGGAAAATFGEGLAEMDPYAPAHGKPPPELGYVDYAAPVWRHYFATQARLAGRASPLVALAEDRALAKGLAYAMYLGVTSAEVSRPLTALATEVTRAFLALEAAPLPADAVFWATQPPPGVPPLPAARMGDIVRPAYCLPATIDVAFARPPAFAPPHVHAFMAPKGSTGVAFLFALAAAARKASVARSTLAVALFPEMRWRCTSVETVRLPRAPHWVARSRERAAGGAGGAANDAYIVPADTGSDSDEEEPGARRDPPPPDVDDTPFTIFRFIPA